jgi:general secretion pathway protein C
MKMLRSLITLFLLVSTASAMADEATAKTGDAKARLVPSFSKGHMTGLKIFNLSPDSLLASLGLENGDLVIRANDKSIRSPDDVLSVYNMLKDPQSLRLEIERRGQRLTLPKR